MLRAKIHCIQRNKVKKSEEKAKLMAYYVEKYKCGSCKYFEYASQYEKGYCSWYRTYYHADESCDNWAQNENAEETSGGCFLTTACCEYKGLPDDCRELTVMRNFRDTELKESGWGQRCIDLYYQEAPRILKQIESHPKRDELLEWLYSQIGQIVELVENKKGKEAVIYYLLMVTEADIKSGKGK